MHGLQACIILSPLVCSQLFMDMHVAMSGSLPKSAALLPVLAATAGSLPSSM